MRFMFSQSTDTGRSCKKREQNSHVQERCRQSAKHHFLALQITNVMLLLSFDCSVLLFIFIGLRLKGFGIEVQMRAVHKGVHRRRNRGVDTAEF